MAEHADVLIVGGGVIGLTAAYELAKEGASVLLVEKGDFGKEASWAGAGILSPGNVAKARPGFDQLRAHSAAIFPQLSAELRERTGVDNGYRRCGGIEFLQNEEASREWRQQGIPFEPLSDRELHALEPAAVAGKRHVYHVPGTAQIRNPWHLRALLAGCEMNGVRLHRGCPACGLVRCGARIAAVETATEMMSAGCFLISSGAWTDPLLEPLGIRPGIRPLRGQIALLNTGVPLIRKVLQEDKRYLVPREDGRILVGSTEEDVGFDKRTTASAIAGLLDVAIRLVPALADAAVERCWAGLRPASPDGLPYLGKVPGFDNLFIAAGHGRAGLELSAVTGLLLSQAIFERPLLVPLEPFRVDRHDSPTSIASRP
jgi:glycine oxidase